ncbi:MAG: hypothetical protein C4331_14120 [Meiothermus sp.]
MNFCEPLLAGVSTGIPPVMGIPGTRGWIEQASIKTNKPTPNKASSQEGKCQERRGIPIPQRIEKMR